MRTTPDRGDPDSSGRRADLQFTYDQEVDAAYVHIGDPSLTSARDMLAHEREPTTEVRLDLSADGLLVGIEILGARGYLPDWMTTDGPFARTAPGLVEHDPTTDVLTISFADLSTVSPAPTSEVRALNPFVRYGRISLGFSADDILRHVRVERARCQVESDTAPREVPCPPPPSRRS